MVVVLRSKNRGDTIVEVLIAVAVVSLVLASAYAVVNRSTLAIQSTQEQSYAQKLVERQVELLRSASTAPTPLGGCYDTSANYQTTPGSCTITNGGATYTLAITESASVYMVRATWDEPGGQQAKVTAYYRGVIP